MPAAAGGGDGQTRSGGGEIKRSSGDTIKARYRKYRRYIVEPRQEISSCLKYLLFLVNFVFWICGVACTILGGYLYAKDFRAVFEAIDFFLNPSILLIVCGCIIFLIAFLGCTGALRENVCMLKFFSLCLFFAYICLVILAFVVFMLFYSDTKTGLSIQALLQTGVSKYHENDNMRELMDYLQNNLGCCGATSQGYKDWNNNPLYNCSPSNPTPEQCGVPPSCCKVTAAQLTVVTAATPASGQHQLRLSAAGDQGSMVQLNAEAELPTVNTVGATVVTNPRCGFQAQDKSITDLQNVVYTDGCLQPLQRVFEGNAVIIGAIIGAIIVPVCLSVTFSNVLARQIDRQRYLLEKEARKEERRRRRNRSKFRDPFGRSAASPSSGAPRPDGGAQHGRKRSAAVEATTALQELSPNPLLAALPKKDSSTRLILEDEHEQPGPSTSAAPPRRPAEAVQKRVKLRKRSEEKRSSELDDPQMKRRRQQQQQASAPPKDPTPPALPKDPPPTTRPQPSAPKQPRGRSKSRDQRYTGPIIVEIESTTNESPPLVTAAGPSAPPLTDEPPVVILTVDEPDLINTVLSEEEMEEEIVKLGSSQSSRKGSIEENGSAAARKNSKEDGGNI